MKYLFNLRISLYRTITLFLIAVVISVWFAVTAEPGFSSANADASLSLKIDPLGTALVDVELKLEPPLSQRLKQESLEQIVGETLGCTLQDVREVSGTSSYNGEPRTLRGFDGRCDRVFLGQGLVVQGEVNPAPLLALLRTLKVQAIAIEMQHPQVGFTNVSPSNVSREESNSAVHYTYSLPVATTTATPLLFEFGYRLIDLKSIFALLAAVLLSPLILTLLMRQVALWAQNTDPVAVWFNYFRFLNWVVTGTWIGWLVFLFMPHVSQFIDFLFGIDAVEASWYTTVIDLAVFFLPPTLVIALCYALSHPVFARVRGMKWTSVELVQQALLSQAARVLPWVCVGAGIDALLAGNVRLGVVLFAAAYGCRMVFLPLWLKSQDFTPHALTVGELRDRIFALAQKAGVKLKQIYVLPAGKGQLANAFASVGNQILLSDYLLEQLNKREVDAIVAHELGHLKHNHPEVLGKVGFFVLLFMAIVAGIVAFILPWLPWWLVVGVPFVLVIYLTSRRFEYEADAEAVALSEDAEAFITALYKLTRLNLMPMEWGKLNEQLLTHPSTLRRLQAIASRSGISSEQLQQLLGSSNTDADHYTLPPSVIGEDKVFSTLFKSKIISRISWTLITLRLLIPALAVVLVESRTWEDKEVRAIYLGGLVLTLVVCLLVQNVASVWGYGKLQRQLKAKLEREGIQLDAWGGDSIFVGFAPDAYPRLYEHFFDWDVGFLLLAQQRLCYIGEQTRFALRAEQITAINLGAGAPSWWRSRRIYLSWRDEQGCAIATFNLRPAYVRALHQLPRQVRLLNQRLQAWWEQPNTSLALPESLGELKTPELGTVTSILPREVTNTSQFSSFLFLLGFIAIGVGVLLQLPLVGTGYVFLVACITIIFDYIPYWCYRDPKGD